MTTYPNTGELLIKSGTAIDALLQQTHSDNKNFSALCKSLSADIRKQPEVPDVMIKALSNFHQRMKNEDLATSTIQKRRIAEAMLMKSLNEMQKKGLPASNIVAVRKLCEDTMNASPFGVDFVVATLEDMQK
ncbi:hypothetical protein U9S86_004559 [Salmonella enterica]|nr:hypothetical protein [Salmonella enterica]EHA9546174.1 hypothetical protein [Salmonella enterica subsp. enterica serovar Braenderup]EHP7123046.1 hypothetical protein [Salmonella enterica subsp. enterica serovar Thompson]EBH4941556.1 hypothetical protein [Salmonella enterica]ECK3278480.1 hypothetical protein [Salmonella enterica]